MMCLGDPGHWLGAAEVWDIDTSGDMDTASKAAGSAVGMPEFIGNSSEYIYIWIHFGIYRDFWDTLKSGTLHPVSLTLFGYIYSPIIGIVPALARSFWNSFMGANGPQIWHSWHMSFFCAWKLWSEESWSKRAINLSHLQPAQTSEFNATPS